MRAFLTVLFCCFLAAGVRAADDPLIEGFRLAEAVWVADAMEPLFGRQAYMSHEMRPQFPSRFAGRAITVMLAKGEQEGAQASKGMRDAIDDAPPGRVYVMVVEDGLDYAGIGALRSTAMKDRGLTGAIIEGSVWDTAQIMRWQVPVFGPGAVPSTSINHCRHAGTNVLIICAGQTVSGDEIIVADVDGVAVAPAEVAVEVQKKAQELDDIEHRMLPYIAKYWSMRQAVEQFGRI